MSKKKEQKGGLLDVVELDPQCIYFTHSRIRPYFTGCGVRVLETLSRVEEGRMCISELPLITVLENNGFYFSLNNRRLFVLKALREKGIIDTVRVRMKPALQRERERYTKCRCSLKATIMKEKGGVYEKDEEGEEEEGWADGEVLENGEHLKEVQTAPLTQPPPPLHPVVMKCMKSLQKSADKGKRSQVFKHIDAWHESQYITLHEREEFIKFLGL